MEHVLSDWALVGIVAGFGVFLMMMCALAGRFVK